MRIAYRLLPFAFGVIFLGTAAAQTFPVKPVRILIGSAAGGAVDSVARVLAARMTTSLGTPVIVEPRPGAGGVLAAEAVAKSPADGYTLGLLGVGALAVNPVVLKSISYDVAKDFTYLGVVATVPLALIVHPSVQARTLKEFQVLLSKQPGKFSYASSGVGGPLHLTMEAYKHRAGVDIVHVPYRGGAPAAADVIAGHVPIMFLDVKLAAQHAKAGNVRALAVVAQERSNLLPQTPTFKEAGMPDFNFSAWIGMAAPSGLPREVEAKLAAALQAAASNPEFQSKLQSYGFAAQQPNAAQFQAFVGQELARYRQVVEAQKISVEQ